MKTAISLMLVLAGFCAFAEEPKNLEVTGFKKIDDSKVSTTYMFRDDFKYTISKSKFSKWQEAQQFCSGIKGSKIGDIEHMLLIAMSGAANVDETLKQAIVFDFRHPKDETRKLSGIMGWVTEAAKELLLKTGKDHDVIVMFDGRGTDSQTDNLAEINLSIGQAGVKPHSLHTVCVQSFEKKK